MNWASMHDGFRDGSFFCNLGKLRPKELAGRLQWSPLITTARLWDWLRQDDGAECALRAPRCENAWKTILAVLLERHLLNLNTRFDPRPLYMFWEWVTNAAGAVGPIASVWRDNEDDIRASCGEGTLSYEDIVAQEAKFAHMLRRTEDVLGSAPGKMRWASDVVARLAARHSGGNDGVLPRRSYAQIVFAWDDTALKVPQDFRPAFLIDLELGEQGAGNPFVVPANAFDDTFRQSVSGVATTLVGRRRFHQLQYQPLTGVELPAGSLTGGSGGLAILLTQLLANRAGGRWRKHHFAMPPWVVVTATLDPDAEGRSCPVGAIPAKFRLLREAGVRVVVVADDTAQLTEVTRVLSQFHGRSGMTILRADRLPRRTVERLVEHGCAWPVDIEKAPIIPRRVFVAGIAATTLTAVASAAVGALIFPAPEPVLVPVPQPRPQTESMRLGLELQSMLKAKAREVQSHAALSGIDSYLRDVLGATEISAVPVWSVVAAGLGASPGGQGPFLAAPHLVLRTPEVRRPPATTSFNGLKVLLDSKFFDCTDWAEVASLEELATKPVEPAYFTRVIRIRKVANSPAAIAIEFNTGGLCVIPVMDTSRGDEMFFCTKRMDESKAAEGQTRTTYLKIDISNLGNDGQPFDLTVNAVYINGSQDQRLRVHRSGPKKGHRVEHDWWGTRVVPGVSSADLAIRLPQSRSFGPVTHWVRKEDESGSLVPYREVREGDPLWAPAWHMKGTYTEGPDSVWVIPSEVGEGRDYRWIYSLQWKWE